MAPVKAPFSWPKSSLSRRVSGMAAQLTAILAYHWPGNVRELQNTIKRAVAASRGPTLSAADLRLALPEENAEEPLDLKAVRLAAEGRVLRRAQEIANGNRS